MFETLTVKLYKNYFIYYKVKEYNLLKEKIRKPIKVKKI